MGLAIYQKQSTQMCYHCTYSSPYENEYIKYLYSFFHFFVIFVTEQSFSLQPDTLIQVCVCILQAMSDIRNAPPPTMLFSPGFAQGVIRLGETAPCSPLCHLRLYVCRCVCELDPIWVCACVPIVPPCGQVTITNQVCEPRRKRPRKGPGKGGRGNQGVSSECFPFSSSLKQR